MYTTTHNWNKTIHAAVEATMAALECIIIHTSVHAAWHADIQKKHTYNHNASILDTEINSEAVQHTHINLDHL